MKRTSHWPAGVFLLAAALLTMARCLAGCTALTPEAAVAIEGAVAALCPLEALIPLVGPIAAAACPGEEALLRAALATATASSPPAGASRASLQSLPEVQVAVYRRAPGGLVHVGQVASRAAPAVQAVLTPGGER